MFSTVLCGYNKIVQISHLLGNNSTSSLTVGVFKSFSTMFLPSDSQLHRGATSDVWRFPLQSSCIGADEMKNRLITSQRQEVCLVAVELLGLFTPNETTFSTAADYIYSSHQTGQSSSCGWKALNLKQNQIIRNQKEVGMSNITQEHTFFFFFTNYKPG